jgi:1-acyl-sn-glycerol-3-phosphate acyltransferase
VSGRREPWFHAIRWTVFPLLRVYFRWRFEGLEKIPAEGPVLIACNHASYLDPLVNSYAVVRGGRRPRFLAKRELFGVVGLGSAMRGTKQIPVARGTGDRSALDNAEKALSHGEVVVVYPEGTVTRRDDGLPMEGKTGTVRLALAAGVPIVPMVSWGSSPVWQKSGPGSLRPGRPVWVRVGDPLTLDADGSALADREAVEAYTKQLMATLTDLATDLRDRYPAAWRDR